MTAFAHGVQVAKAIQCEQLAEAADTTPLRVDRLARRQARAAVFA
jgi:hypothetical protein